MTNTANCNILQKSSSSLWLSGSFSGWFGALGCTAPESYWNIAVWAESLYNSDSRR